MNQQSSLSLKIADYSITFYTNCQNLILVSNLAYHPFIKDYKTSKKLNIEIIPGIPDFLLSGQKVFSANNYFEKTPIENNLWDVYKCKKKYVIATPKNNISNKHNVFLVIDFNSTDWKMYIEYKGNTAIRFNPFFYPLAPLILYYITNLNKAVLIHASGVEDNNNGLIFSGVSGVGKSTIANLWTTQGAKLINDDRLVIRKKNDDYYVHNTPMFYEDSPKCVKLSYIFLLSQYQSNFIKKLTGVYAISRLMAFCIQHDYHQLLVENLIDAVTDIASKIPVYELGFYPDEKVVEYVRKEIGDKSLS